MLYTEKQCGKTKYQIWSLPKYGQILTTPTANRTTADLLYRLLHYVTTTNKYTFTISRDKKNLTPNCDFCNMTEDNYINLSNVTEFKIFGNTTTLPTKNSLNNNTPHKNTS